MSIFQASYEPLHWWIYSCQSVTLGKIDLSTTRVSALFQRALWCNWKPYSLKRPITIRLKQKRHAVNLLELYSDVTEKKNRRHQYQ